MSLDQSVVTKFENMIAGYTGAPYACAVDCCTNALFLCLYRWKNILHPNLPVYKTEIPEKIKGDTIYRGVKRALELAGFEYNTYESDSDFISYGMLTRPSIFDNAHYFNEDIFIPDNLMCLSFGYEKKLSIGRGGAILTDSKEAWQWFKDATMLGGMGKETSDWGWSMYLAPELAAIGIQKLKGLINVKP